MIHIENLVKRYGDLIALDHLNLDIKEGEKNILDVPASVVATMAAGGYPTLQYRAGRRPIEYLFLILVLKFLHLVL